MTRTARWGYWVLLGASFLFALPFALYFFLIGPPLTVAVFIAGAYTTRWPASAWIVPTLTFVPAAIAAIWIAVSEAGTDAAWAAPFAIWLAAAYFVFAFTVGQLYGHRRKRHRNEGALGSPQPI